jgi:hypothetical protein
MSATCHFPTLRVSCAMLSRALIGTLLYVKASSTKAALLPGSGNLGGWVGRSTTMARETGRLTSWDHSRLKFKTAKLGVDSN